MGFLIMFAKFNISMQTAAVLQIAGPSQKTGMQK